MSLRGGTEDRGRANHLPRQGLHGHAGEPCELALRRFLDDGAVPIDNGVVEWLHVRTALTRKNFLFVGGKRAAIVYTMLACCSLAEVDPVEYLADLLPRLGGRHCVAELAELMPTIR